MPMAATVAGAATRILTMGTKLYFRFAMGDLFTVAYAVITSPMMGILAYLIYLAARGVLWPRRAWVLGVASSAMMPEYSPFLPGGVSSYAVLATAAASLAAASVVVRARCGRLCLGIAVTAIVAEEYVMGAAFAHAVLGRGLPQLLIDAVNNPVFAAMMLVDAAAVYVARRRLTDLLYGVEMASAPNAWFFLGRTAEFASAALSSAVMMGVIVLIYRGLTRNVVPRNDLVHGLAIGYVYLATMIGFAYASATGDYSAMGLAMLLGMPTYLAASLATRSDAVRWDSGPWIPMAVIVALLGAEITMGLGLNQVGFRYVHGEGAPPMVKPGADPLSWLFYMDILRHFEYVRSVYLGPVVDELFDATWLFMASVMNPVFVLMMGSEMLVLIIDRARELVRAGHRGLAAYTYAVGAGTFAFALFAAFYTPAYLYGMSGHGVWPYTPETVAASVAAATLAVFLFGRRAWCGLVCMAAHMYVNTFYIRFAAGRYSWTRLSADRGAAAVAVKAVTALSAALSLLGFAMYFAAYAGVAIPPPPHGTWLDVISMWQVHVIWFFLYFATPLFGAYNCSRLGYCGFGTLMGLIGNRLGMFAIRGNPEACAGCGAPCQSACPVKIPVKDLVTRVGEVRDYRCVGCGACVAACPRGALRIVDARYRFSLLLRRS